MLKSCIFQRFSENEKKIYLVVWVVSVIYALYQFALVSQKYFHNYEDNYNDFTTGWWFTNLKQDKVDFEFETIKFFLKNVFPVVLLYLLVREVLLIWIKNDKVQKWLCLIFTFSYLHYSMGTTIVLLATFQPIAFYLFAKNTPLIWIANLISLGLVSICKMPNVAETLLKNLNHFEISLNIFMWCWMNLKCTAFALERNKSKNGYSILEYLEYCFHTPTLFTGPFIAPEEFIRRKKEKLDVRLLQLTFNLSRCCFWLIFTDFYLHFVYVNATSFQLKLIKKFDLCTLCGYGYAMGQFFHLKYIIIYGFSTSLSSFQMIQVPPLPRCIGRVHLYSDMWKYFDHGLYIFLKRYLLIPLLKSGISRLLANLICFTFVFIWHGLEYYIFIWATLNFFGICLEEVANRFYIRTVIKYVHMKENNLRKIKCAFAAPLLAVSALSNFYFFGGKDVGDLFVQKSMSEPFLNKCLLISILYCCCQVSVEIRDLNARKM